jgi:hypothetical protein
VAEPGVDRADITGLVLAGGQGSRLGGVDKGLQPYRGQPLAFNAMQRLAPQVGRVMLSANRHLDTYARWGVPVWPDPADLAGYQGPLAGVLGRPGSSPCPATARTFRSTWSTVSPTRCAATSNSSWPAPPPARSRLSA